MDGCLQQLDAGQMWARCALCSARYIATYSIEIL